MKVAVDSILKRSRLHLHRLAESCRIRMFGRNTVASAITFSLDLLILWAMVELLSVSRILAAVVAYLVAITLFYVASREWVFPRTHRDVASGYFYFLVNVGIGLLVMLAMYWVLLELTDLFYLLARILSSIISGIIIFLLNGIFNFKQL